MAVMTRKPSNFSLSGFKEWGEWIDKVQEGIEEVGETIGKGRGVIEELRGKPPEEIIEEEKGVPIAMGVFEKKNIIIPIVVAGAIVLTYFLTKKIGD